MKRPEPSPLALPPPIVSKLQVSQLRKAKSSTTSAVSEATTDSELVESGRVMRMV
jgi:hypothetical protein